MDVKCRFQKASLYGWAGGSLCTVVSESWELLQLNKIKRKDESEEAWQARQNKAIADINSHSLVLFHAVVQVQHPKRSYQPDAYFVSQIRHCQPVAIPQECGDACTAQHSQSRCFCLSLP